MLTEFWQDNKKLFLVAAVAAAMIIGICWLFFDFRVVSRTQDFLGVPRGCLVILDEVPSKNYFQKILPLAQKNNVPIGIGAEVWHVQNWQKFTDKPISEYLGNVEIIPMAGTVNDNDSSLKNLALSEKRLMQEKDIFVQAGLKIDYAIGPWRQSNIQKLEPLLKKHYKLTVFRWGETAFEQNRKENRSDIISMIVPWNRPMEVNQICGFIDMVESSRKVGILFLRGYNQKSFTANGTKVLQDAIQYAKENEVQIVTLHKVLEDRD